MDSAMQGVSARLWNVGSMGQRGVTLSLGRPPNVVASALSLGRSISGLEPGGGPFETAACAVGRPNCFRPGLRKDGGSTFEIAETADLNSAFYCPRFCERQRRRLTSSVQ